VTSRDQEAMLALERKNDPWLLKQWSSELIEKRAGGREQRAAENAIRSPSSAAYKFASLTLCYLSCDGVVYLRFERNQVIMSKTYPLFNTTYWGSSKHIERLVRVRQPNFLSLQFLSMMFSAYHDHRMCLPLPFPQGYQIFHITANKSISPKPAVTATPSDSPSSNGEKFTLSSG